MCSRNLTAVDNVRLALASGYSRLDENQFVLRTFGSVSMFLSLGEFVDMYQLRHRLKGVLSQVI